MVPSEILTRLFSLRVGNQLATGFTIEVDHRQYLITARHFVDSAPDANRIEVFRNSAWTSISFQRIVVSAAVIDIAILAVSEQLSTPMPVAFSFKGASLSEQVFFLGFPFGLSIQGTALNRGFPLPLVKHGIIAAFRTDDQPGQPFLIDGINNPGFSGGPVVRLPRRGQPTIIGVISGYRASQEPVYDSFGKTPMSVQANTA